MRIPASVAWAVALSAFVPGHAWQARPQTAQDIRVILLGTPDGVEAGAVLAKVKPKLAVFSHYNVDPKTTLPLVRKQYDGPVEFGQDLMTIDVGEQVTIQRPGGPYS